MAAGEDPPAWGHGGVDPRGGPLPAPERRGQRAPPGPCSSGSSPSGRERARDGRRWIRPVAPRRICLRRGHGERRAAVPMREEGGGSPVREGEGGRRRRERKGRGSGHGAVKI
ncbi:hypothetical protein C2845_PM09G18970 [Panicum miliaceum]|uniref:Uncharacterized protein n=1 Tax=Panicum miliaceum TaxID=4540 RepID=A0A3L6S0F6_PANMI|nr:hypothetical protein C2845_PM09G18970 [Panicum miliaceum]